jgi:hypothetical protein
MFEPIKTIEALAVTNNRGRNRQWQTRSLVRGDGESNGAEGCRHVERCGMPSVSRRDKWWSAGRQSPIQTVDRTSINRSRRVDRGRRAVRQSPRETAVGRPSTADPIGRSNGDSPMPPSGVRSGKPSVSRRDKRRRAGRHPPTQTDDRAAMDNEITSTTTSTPANRLLAGASRRAADFRASGSF